MKGKKLNSEEFAKRTEMLYGRIYDISKADVENRDEKGRVCIICPEHGEFWKTPNNFLSGHGCPKCSFNIMGSEKVKNTDWFISEAKKIHGNKYDYSRVAYNGRRCYVDIICPKHGIFKQTAGNHLAGRGCKECAKEKIRDLKLMTTEEFIKKANKIHNFRYKYNRTDLNNRDEKGRVCIICPEHGEFWQTPSSHLQGNGCYKCKSKKISKTKTKNTDWFISKARKVHGDKYDYSRVDYKGSLTPVNIICPKHGIFSQKPSIHLLGSGCPLCANNQPIDLNEFINRSRKVHENKYDYSKAEYKNNHTKTTIICHEKDKNGIEHGEFMTTPHSHMQGSGCPKCKQNYKLEAEVRLLLKENNINFEEKKTFNGLKNKISLKPDFYLPDEKIMIECQGEQHFKPVDFGGNGKEVAKKEFELTKKRDEIKRIFCEKNGIRLIEYTHVKSKKDGLVKTKEDLLKIIRNDYK